MFFSGRVQFIDAYISIQHRRSKLKMRGVESSSRGSTKTEADDKDVDREHRWAKVVKRRSLCALKRKSVAGAMPRKESHPEKATLKIGGRVARAWRYPRLRCGFLAPRKNVDKE